MARSKPEAASTATEPDENDVDAVELAAGPTDSELEPTNWRYTGPPGRIYSAIPVTVDPGDVIRHFGVPAADGAWEPTDEPVSRRPDNWRPDPDEAPAPADEPAKEG